MTLTEAKQALIGKTLRISDGVSYSDHKITEVYQTIVRRPAPEEDLKVFIINDCKCNQLLTNAYTNFAAATIADLITNGKVVMYEYSVSPYDKAFKTQAFIELIK